MFLSIVMSMQLSQFCTVVADWLLNTSGEIRRVLEFDSLKMVVSKGIFLSLLIKSTLLNHLQSSCSSDKDQSSIVIQELILLKILRKCY
jgi:hypothetical protein